MALVKQNVIKLYNIFYQISLGKSDMVQSLCTLIAIMQLKYNLQ